MVDKLFLWSAAGTEALVLISITLESTLAGWPHKPQDPRVKIPLFLSHSHGHMHLTVSLRGTACFSSWSVLTRERAAKPHLLTSRPTHHPVVPSHGLPAISTPSEQGPSLPAGVRRGFTLLCQAPVLCKAGHGCSFYLTRGEHVTAWDRPQVQSQAQKCKGKYLSYYLIAN